MKRFPLSFSPIEQNRDSYFFLIEFTMFTPISPKSVVF